MTNFKKKLITGIATGAILLNAFTPLAFASTTIEISGNGSSSDNTANVTTSTTTTVVQRNDANVSNNVDSNATTGGNDANDNTGGDVTIKTGNAKANVDVSTEVNANKADVNGCNCDNDANVLISGNGSNSDNDANLKTSNNVEVFQTNDAYVRNNVDTDAKTGGNDANRNTGGDVTIMTGNASTDVDVKTQANANIASVGGSNGGSSDISLKILGNGSKSDSDNDINLTSNQSVVLVQDNSAYVYNNVDADAKTGYNDANDNTGGDVTIDTGDANVNVDVDNMVNFNAADVDCGCLTDVLAKISGNGTNSDNDIKAKIEKKLSEFQDNASDLYNYVDGDAKTGGNDAKRNTGPVAHDPTEIMTGDAKSDTSVKNSGNVNVSGPSVDWHFPEGFDLDFHFDLSILLSLLHLV